MKGTRVSVNTFEGVNYHTKIFAPLASSSHLPSQQSISLPHYNVVLDNHLVSERWLKSSEFHDGLQMHEHTRAHVHTCTHSPPQSPHAHTASYQVIKTWAQPWSFVLSRSLWLLSGWLFFSHLSICVGGSQSTIVPLITPQWVIVAAFHSLLFLCPCKSGNSFMWTTGAPDPHFIFQCYTCLFHYLFWEKLKYTELNLLY